jgi:predicted nucleic acid-binding protein
MGGCLIAATALRLDMEVATVNEKHFRAIPRLKVFRPY